MAIDNSQRLTPLDAARGLAMLGVCVSHFGIGISGAEAGIGAVLLRMGMIASPTFIFLSGAVLGYLITLRRDTLERFKVQLADRALFLLTIAHLAIDGAHYQRFHRLVDLTHALFMTDTIGVSLLLGILLVPRTRIGARLSLAAALYTAGWLVVLFWHPDPTWEQLLKEVMVGSTNQYTDIRQNFPIVPWFSIFLAATVLGEAMAAARVTGGLARIGQRLLRAGPLCIIAAGVIKELYLRARPMAWPDYDSMPPLWKDLFDLTTPFDKYPPGPTYLLGYGGLALVLIGLVVIASERGWFSRVLETAAVVGRASLFVFVVQFYIYYLLVPRLPLAPRWLLVPWFAASVATLWILAYGWNRISGNRFFTVGLMARGRRREVVPRPA